MGVPGLYRYLVHRYPNIKRRFNDPSSPIINNLFIDANQIIYQSFATVKDSNDVKEIVTGIINYIDFLIKLCKPTDLIFLAFDGPPPLAKIKNQRNNRFIDFMESGDINRCKICPGTEFTDDINKVIKKLFEERINNKIYKAKKIIFSGFYDYGEGEHKIISYIRNEKSNGDWDSSRTSIFYTNDADCILLSLSLHEPNMIILKEINASAFQAEYKPFEVKQEPSSASYSSFELVYIGLIREYLKIEFGCNDDNLEYVIDDFVAISIFLGTDFCPNIFLINVKKGDFETILESYKNEFLKSGEHILKNSEIVHSSLKKIVKIINEALKNKFKENSETKLDEFLSKHNNNEEIAKKEYEKQIDYLYELANYQYLEKRYPDENIVELAAQMSRSFLDIYYWIIEYYYKGLSNSTTNYKFCHSPPIYYLLQNMDYEPENAYEDFRITPFLQLLMILPLGASKLLPPSFAKIFDNEDVIQQKPTSFEIDDNDQIRSYQYIPILPYIDIEFFRNKYESAIDTAPESELERDHFEPAIIYENGESNDLEIEIFVEEIADITKTKNIPIKYPTLYSLPFTHEFKAANVRMFEKIFHGISCVIKPTNNNQLFKSLNDVIPYIKEEKKVLVGYPFYVPAIIVKARTETHKIKNGTVVRCNEPIPPYVERALMRSRAIELNDKNILLTCKVSNVVSDSGLVDLSNTTSLTFATTIKPYSDKNVITKLESPKVGDMAVITNGNSIGSHGIIEKIEGEKATLKITIKYGINRNDLIKYDKRRWTPLTDVCKTVKLPFAVVKAFCSELKFEGDPTNYAMCYFTPGMRTVIDNFCKIVDNNIYINDFYSKFKEFVSLITYAKQHYDATKGETKTPFINAPKSILTRDNDKIEENMKSLEKFLNENSPCTKSFEVPVSKVSAAYETISYYHERLLEEGVNNIETTVTVPLSDIIVPLGKVAFTNAEIQLFSRFTIIRKECIHPFGETGVIIGYNIEANRADVIFDNELQTTNYLNGKIPTKRGGSVYINDIIIY